MKLSVVVLPGTLSMYPFSGSVSSSIVEFVIFACELKKIIMKQLPRADFAN